MTTLKDVNEFVYLGLRLDSALSMKPAVREMQARANNAHALVAAVSYSTRYDKRRWNPSDGSASGGCSPSKILQLWKANVLPHYLLNLRYLHCADLVSSLQTSLTKSFESSLHAYS